MAPSLFSFHSFLQYFLLLIIPALTLYYYISYKKNRPYLKRDEIFARMNVGFTHLQATMGIIVMTHSTKINFDTKAWSDPLVFKYTVIHPLIMMITVIFVSLAFMYVKKLNEDSKKHKLSFVFNLLAFVFLLFGLSLVHLSS